MAKGRHRGEGRHLFNTDHNTQGKGDAERVADMERFRANMDEVNFPGVKGLQRDGNRLKKTYK
jgi:hypothetical protein